MNFTEISSKLEHAFNVTGIPKADTCTLWANLSSALLYSKSEGDFAYPVYGTLTFKNKQTNETGHYDDSNDSFHMATLYYSDSAWYLLDFSTNYLITDKYNIISLHDCPIKVEVPELNIISGQEFQKIDEILKKITRISIETNKYTYSFCPQTVKCLLNEQNLQELNELDMVLYG
ncbi:hypothetical protein C6P27_10995 [Weissella confusa]|uniref:hypothetical protein n=1 Tax=Weissella confusa TaxID=1583 RepID=UPI0010819068|nr:hypothetical protein [Weissella confusa]MBJ7637752.1 hypothetical protein [Weissella confusa]TGE46096.1 hypothetical protein C6P27_10995 [Weissella confusa]